MINRNKIVMILILIIMLTYCFQTISLVKIKKSDSNLYYKNVKYINNNLKKYKKYIKENYENLNLYAAVNYSSAINEYAQIISILPNHEYYDDIVISLVGSISKIARKDEMNKQQQIELQQTIIKDIILLSKIFELMEDSYKNQGLKYYNDLNNENSYINKEIKTFVSKLYYENVKYISDDLKKKKYIQVDYENLTIDDVSNYSSSIDEYIEFISILPNYKYYNIIITSLRGNISKVAKKDEMNMQEQRKLKQTITKEIIILTKIFELMEDNFKNHDPKYYDDLNNENSDINKEIKKHFKEWRETKYH